MRGDERPHPSCQRTGAIGPATVAGRRPGRAADRSHITKLQRDPRRADTMGEDRSRGDPWTIPSTPVPHRTRGPRAARAAALPRGRQPVRVVRLRCRAERAAAHPGAVRARLAWLLVLAAVVLGAGRASALRPGRRDQPRHLRRGPRDGLDRATILFVEPAASLNLPPQAYFSRGRDHPLARLRRPGRRPHPCSHIAGVPMHQWMKRHPRARMASSRVLWGRVSVVFATAALGALAGCGSTPTVEDSAASSPESTATAPSSVEAPPTAVATDVLGEAGNADAGTTSSGSGTSSGGTHTSLGGGGTSGGTHASGGGAPTNSVGGPAVPGSPHARVPESRAGSAHPPARTARARCSRHRFASPCRPTRSPVTSTARPSLSSIPRSRRPAAVRSA